MSPKPTTCATGLKCLPLVVLDIRAWTNTPTSKSRWCRHVASARRPDKCKVLGSNREVGQLIDRIESSIQAKVEPLFRTIKRQYRHGQGLLPALEEEQTSDHHMVCLGQSVDGRAQAAGHGTGAPVLSGWDWRTPGAARRPALLSPAQAPWHGSAEQIWAALSTEFIQQ